MTVPEEKEEEVVKKEAPVVKEVEGVRKPCGCICTCGHSGSPLGVEEGLVVAVNEVNIADIPEDGKAAEKVEKVNTQ